MADKKVSIYSYLSQLEKIFELYLVKKVPAISNTYKDLLVVFVPWLTIFTIIKDISILFSAFGGSLKMRFAFLIDPFSPLNFGIGYSFLLILLTIAIVFYSISLVGLYQRSTKGWKFLYWATLISFISNLFGFNPVGNVLWSLIVLYFLFQIKKYYK